ncbi:hypothetical protein [Sphingobium olei]|uniref:SGNH/GDSL hydrolase family protein n=1 Tax=Sphingobium olei TaxID=420955 RepID=A0ABW3P5U0_9SPHN
MSAALAIQAKAIAARAMRSQLSQGAVLTSPAGLRRFRAALGDALHAPVHIACWGDSITEGVGTENSTSIVSNSVADMQGWPGQLRSLLAARQGLPGGGAMTPFFSGSDSRVTRSGTPTSDSVIGPMKWGARIKSSDMVEFTTPACTAIDILYWAGGTTDGSVIGGFTYQIDGGTVTTGLAGGANATPGYRVLSLTNLANSVHVVRLVGGHATNVQHVSGIRYHNGQGVVVSRWGRAGWTVPDMLGIGESSRNNAATGSAHSRSRLLSAIGGFGEHLTIVALGQNDATLQNVAMGGGSGGEAIGTLYPTVETYEAQLRSVVAGVVAAGGCCLLLNTALPPSGGVTVPAGGQPYYAYHEAARRIAADTDHVAHLSLADRWGRAGDASMAENVSLGLLSASTSVHPSRRGYGDIAGALVQTLLRPDLVSG